MGSLKGVFIWSEEGNYIYSYLDSPKKNYDPNLFTNMFLAIYSLFKEVVGQEIREISLGSFKIRMSYIHVVKEVFKKELIFDPELPISLRVSYDGSKYVEDENGVPFSTFLSELSDKFKVLVISTKEGEEYKLVYRPFICYNIGKKGKRVYFSMMYYANDDFIKIDGSPFSEYMFKKLRSIISNHLNEIGPAVYEGNYKFLNLRDSMDYFINLYNDKIEEERLKNVDLKIIDNKNLEEKIKNTLQELIDALNKHS